MLTGPEIIRRRSVGSIVIDPFDESHVGSNSYDLTLHPNLLVYTDAIIDMRRENECISIPIPDYGFVMKPGELYLGMTNEIAGARGLVPCINGKSSIGRLGIQVHVTAGFGDDGFVNRWTLEMTAVRPVRIYPNVKICQIYFEELQGERSPYKGKYKEACHNPIPSRMFMELKEENASPPK